jgi:signal transduction histidine kinase
MAGRHFQTPDGLKRVVLIARDVTERKRAEEARLELEGKLGQSEKMQALGTLAGGIAHDFNNLLTAIIGNTELLHMDVGRLPMAQESLNQIQDAAGRAKDLVQQILTFSRPQLHKREPIQLKDAVAEALKLVATATPANVKLHTSFAPDLPLIEADASQMHQIVINLCTNGVHAMEQRGGFLSVSLEVVNLDEAFTSQHEPLQPGRHVCLMVSDTGIGMEPETVKRIFEPFYTTKVQGKGTGLGLSVVHGIVRKHEGAIMVHSRPHMGTRFSVYFRAISSTELPGQSTIPSSLPRGQGEHVLLIDDEPLVASTGRRILEGLGYRTTVFHDPVQALDAFRFEPYQFSLVITDLTMPAMSGVLLARELLAIRANLPIILVTGFGGNIEPEGMTEVGVRGVVGKPFTAEQLAFQIRRCLAEKPVT